MTWTTQPRSDVGDLSAIIAGVGQDVLLIHGVGLQAEAWALQITGLAAHYRVTAVDMPGHGQSALPPERMDLSGYTMAVANTLSAPALIIGHSMGAMVALELAVRFPHHVRGVAALNAIYRRSEAATAAVNARAASLDGVTKADPNPTVERWFGSVQSPERNACERWLRAVSPAGYKMAYDVFAQEAGVNAHALSGLASPALFMTGADEPNSTPAMSHAMAALAPRGRAQVIANAAHMMPMTHAHVVNEHLLHFAGEVFA